MSTHTKITSYIYHRTPLEHNRKHIHTSNFGGLTSQPPGLVFFCMFFCLDFGGGGADGDVRQAAGEIR